MNVTNPLYNQKPPYNFYLPYKGKEENKKMKTKNTHKIKTIGIGTIGLLISLAILPNIAADTNTTTPLMMAQNENIGDITIVYVDVNGSDDYLKITYTLTNPNWTLNETHLDVQSDPNEFPMTKSGNPKVGHFAYQNDTHQGETSYTYIIYGEWDAGDTLYVAAHAEVSTLETETEEILNDDGTTTTITTEYYVYETAWGNGEGFPGNNWAMYYTVNLV